MQVYLYDMCCLCIQGRGSRLSLGPLQHVTDAGLNLMPAFDKLATSLIGDNPALTEALRWVQHAHVLLLLRWT